MSKTYQNSWRKKHEATMQSRSQALCHIGSRGIDTRQLNNSLLYKVMPWGRPIQSIFLVSICIYHYDLSRSYLICAWCLGYVCDTTHGFWTSLRHQEIKQYFSLQRSLSWGFSHSDMAPALQPDVEHVRDLFEAFVLNEREREYLRIPQVAREQDSHPGSVHCP